VYNTELSLDVSSSNNVKVIRLYDTSFYYKDETVENYMIEVLPVNKTTWITFNVGKNFSLVLNSSNLRYDRVNDEAKLIALPDGLYEIKQSYKPNSRTLHHFYYFRTTALSNTLQDLRTKLIGKGCRISRGEYILNRDKLRDVEEYLKAAKWIIEEEHNVKEGVEMYEFTKELIDKYSNECQC